MVTSFTDYSVRGDYFWTYNNQLVFSQDIIAIDEFKLFALDIKTMKLRNVIAQQKVRVMLLNRNKRFPDIITIRMNKRDPANFDIYRLNIRTGELALYLQNPGNITQWYPDEDGKIRLVKESDGVNETILYRANDNSAFKPIIENNFKTLVDPVAFTGEKNYFYAISNVDRDKTALVEINAEDGKERRVIFACKKADIQDVKYSKNRRVFELVAWQADKPQKHFLDSTIKHIYDNLTVELKGNVVDIVDRDSAENKFVINTYTDRNPGSFYLYELNTKKLTKLGDINP